MNKRCKLAPKEPAKRVKVARLTPFQQQVIDIKAKHLEKVLLFESGYQFKLYAQDAIAVAKSLNYNLKSGWGSTVEPLDSKFNSFASITINKGALDTSLKGFVGRGFKVGVVTMNVDTKGAIHREVTEVHSSGTSDMGGCKSIVSVFESGSTITLACINIFLGRIVYDQFTDKFTRSELRTRLMYLEPNEIILVGYPEEETTQCVQEFKQAHPREVSNMIRIVTMAKEEWDTADMLEYVRKESFCDEVFSFLSACSLELLRCFHSIMRYLEEYGLAKLLNNHQFYTHYEDIARDSVVLDAIVVRNLEVFQNTTDYTESGTLLSFLDHTTTRMGRRQLIEWIKHPLVNRSLISKRHGIVEAIIGKMGSIQMENVSKLLGIFGSIDMEVEQMRIMNMRSSRLEVYKFLKAIEQAYDLFNSDNLNKNLYTLDSLGSRDLHETLIGMIDTLNGDNVRELVKLKGMIHSPAAIDTKDNKSHQFEYFNGNHEELENLNRVRERIDKVSSEFDEELMTIRSLMKKPDLKWTHIQQGSYVVTVRRAEVAHVPVEWIKVHSTANTTSYHTPGTKVILNKLHDMEEEMKMECEVLFQKFMGKVNAHYGPLNALFKAVSAIDVLYSFAKVSIARNLHRPDVVDHPSINLIGCRNPVMLGMGQLYIPSDIHFTGTVVMSGPNMGGKSTVMRSVGMNIILNQVGCFVPCEVGSEMGVFSKFVVRLGARDDLFGGRSTFEVEMLECAEAFRALEGGEPALVLLDEVGRGTSTRDGGCLAKSIAEYVRGFPNGLVVFVTHYPELEQLEGVSHYHMGYSIVRGGNVIKGNTDVELDDDVVFTYRLRKGFTKGSFGVYCAMLAGMERHIIENANSVSKERELADKRRWLGRAWEMMEREEWRALLEYA